MKWNEVTWYSRLGAIILFVGVLPVLSFYIGMEYEKLNNTDTGGIVYEKEITKERETVSVLMPDGKARSYPVISKEEATQLFDDCKVESATDAHAGTFLKNSDGVTFAFNEAVDYGWLSDASKKAFWCSNKPSIGME